jgi:hypothetical protein
MWHFRPIAFYFISVEKEGCKRCIEEIWMFMSNCNQFNLSLRECLPLQNAFSIFFPFLVYVAFPKRTQPINIKKVTDRTMLP